MAEDLEELPRALVVKALDLAPLQGIPTKLRVTCTAPPPMSTGGKVVIGILAALAALAVVGTLLDLQINGNLLPLEYLLSRRRSSYGLLAEEYDLADTRPLSDATTIGGENDDAEKLVSAKTPLQETYDVMKGAIAFQLLLAFSVSSNFNKLLAPAPPGDMPVLNGIRVLSLFWVIMGHTWSAIIAIPMMNIRSMIDVVQRFRFQPIYAGYFSVDSFFMLSGFLVAYLFVRQLEKVRLAQFIASLHMRTRLHYHHTNSL